MRVAYRDASFICTLLHLPPLAPIASTQIDPSFRSRSFKLVLRQITVGPCRPKADAARQSWRQTGNNIAQPCHRPGQNVLTVGQYTFDDILADHSRIASLRDVILLQGCQLRGSETLAGAFDAADDGRIAVALEPHRSMRC